MTTLSCVACGELADDGFAIGRLCYGCIEETVVSHMKGKTVEQPEPLELAIDQLDTASGELYNAMDSLKFVHGLPDVIKRQIEMIDISRIDMLKHELEIVKAKKDHNVLCPKCDVNFLHPDEVHNSISREDDETEICNDCGRAEAMADMNF